MTDDQIAALREAALAATHGPGVVLAILDRLAQAERERDDAHAAQRAAETELASQMARLTMRADDAERERDALRADAERFRWLRRYATEEPLRPGTLDSEWPDLRTYWRLPRPIAYGPVGGPTRSLDEAIDAALAGEK